MAFEGYLVNRIEPYHGDFSNVFMVGVSGSGINLWGHAILFVPNVAGSLTEGLYFHVVGTDAGVFTAGEFPRCMPCYADFQKYLSENGKTELFRKSYKLPNPQDAIDRLNELTAKPRVWLAIKHNCVTFVHAIVHAGGNYAFFNNLPTHNYPNVWIPYEAPWELAYL